MIELVSSVNRAYWERCGRALLASMEKFVSKGIDLRLYCDGSLEGVSIAHYGIESMRVRVFELGALDGVRRYVEDARDRMGARWPDDPADRLTFKGYDYRRDAVTFGKKGMSIAHALASSRAELLFWVDADTVFRKPVDEAWFTAIMDGADIAYFGRKKPHSETGFIGFRMGAPGIQVFLKRYGSCWRDRRIFDLAGWTDSDAFDWALAETAGHLRLKNLSTEPEGHVVASSPLGAYIEHRKGSRKLGGKR